MYRPVGLSSRTCAQGEVASSQTATQLARSSCRHRTSSSPPTATSSSRPDLFKTRLPKHLRDRGVWEEDFEIEPLVEGGARIFRRLHTPGFEGWTISRYRQTSGRMPEGDPEQILEDMDLDGVDVQVMHPNLSLFGLYSDDHELSMAPRPGLQRLRHRAVRAATSRSSRRPRRFRSPTSPTPSPRSSAWPPAASGPSCCRRPRPCPTTRASSTRSGPPHQANGMQIFFHTQTGGVKVNDPASTTLKVVMENAAAGQSADDREGRRRSA